jgi:nitrile hydratase subunit beta
VNGVHDVGGMHGFGPIHREEAASVFHAPWEGRVRAMMHALRHRHVFNTDEMRRTIESLPPGQYLTSTYFERWLAALRMLLIEKGVLTAAEIDAAFQQLARAPERPLECRPNPQLADAILEDIKHPRRTAFDRPAPRFRSGDRVVAKNQHVKEHTRLPRYVRGKRGVIHRVHGVYTFPDTFAHGRGERPQPVYSVCFAAHELWGDAGSPNHGVYIDLWESYLEPA